LYLHGIICTKKKEPNTFILSVVEAYKETH
jgi:hypothetical protein